MYKRVNGGLIINFEDLPRVRRRHRNQVIVFCSGAFDLAHAGHVLFFEDCKKQGDVLVVEVAHDALMKKYKGDQRPVLNEHVRLKMVSALKPVDYCFLDFPIEGDPLSLFNLVFRRLKPNKYVINEDAFDIPYRAGLAAKHGVELIILPRWCPPEFEGISTSKIIEKILATFHK